MSSLNLKTNSVPLKLLLFLNFAAFIPVIIGVTLKILPLRTLSLVIFFFYSLYYLKKAQKSIDGEIGVTLGSIADFKFILWPVILVICTIILKTI